MESVKGKMRFKLALGRYRVVSVNKDALSCQFKIDMGNSCIMTVEVPAHADVREGDLLTFYTEVLTHDPSLQTPQQ